MDDHVVVREGLRALRRGPPVEREWHPDAATPVLTTVDVSVRSVENHRASVMRTLGLRTLAEPVRHANEAGLV